MTTAALPATHPPQARALVTGAGSRLGRAIALRLAAAGYDLTLHGFSSGGGLQETANEARSMGRSVLCVQSDLTIPSGRSALAEAFLSLGGGLELLVHNAACFSRCPLEQLTPALLRQTLALNLEAPLLLTQALLPALKQASAACVLMLTDALTGCGMPESAHYLASKAGLEAVIRALAVELAPTIRVNGVAPGTVFFPEDYSSDLLAQLLARTPLARPGNPDDVASAVLYLAQAAPFVTGQILRVDGGRSIRL